ncbi:hypothetical protein [Glycomyces rhizosphaerae]|uniref:FtsX-like permease family protein n=1 Tax=Glycomyces rhizosphaerae TaxID=2054422 RepID=A0ABV7PW07_9ACTN
MTNAHKLTRQLLVIGFAAGRRAEAGRIRFAALAAATTTLALALATIAAIGIASAARLDRAGEGVPTLAEPDAPETGLLLMESAFDELENDRQFQVFYLDPVGPDAPLPPGLTDWPEPGQAYLSPRLASAGADEGIADRYGEFGGLIDTDSLADPGEQLAYVRPVGGLDTVNGDPLRVVGFDSGGDPENAWGVHWLLIEQDFSIGGLIAIALAMLLLPSALLTVVAVRTGAALRDRREHLITVLGGNRRSRFLISLGESALPVAIGAIGSAIAIIAASSFEFTVPYAEFVIARGDLLQGWWLLVLCPVSAGAMVLLVSAILGARATDRRSNRPRPARRPRLLLLWATLCPVFICVATVLPPLFAGTPGYALSNLIGVAGVIATLPSAIAVSTAWLASRVERIGRTRNKPSLLIIGRRIVAHPRATARQISGVATGAVLLCLVLGYQGLFSEQAVSAQQYLDRYGYQMVQVSANGAPTEPQADRFLVDLTGRLDFVAATVDSTQDTSISFYGDCQSLEVLSLPCPPAGQVAQLTGTLVDQRLENWVSGFRFGDLSLTVQEADVPVVVAEHDALMLGFTPNGGEVSVADVKSAGKVFTTGVSVEAPGESWLTGAVPHRDQARWVGLFGAIGLMVLAGVAAVGAAGEFIRSSRALSPLVAVTGRTTVFRNMAALAVWTPLFMASVGGFAVGVWVTRPLTSMGQNLITPGLLLACSGLVLIVGALMWWWASATMIKEASEWRPGRSD